MGFDEALKEHNEIKVRLILYLNNTGHLDTTDLASPDQCALGKWLVREQRQSPKCEIVAKMMDLHKAFHFCAAEIVSLLQQGLKTDAREFVQPDGQLTRLSTAMAEAVVAFKRKQQAA